MILVWALIDPVDQVQNFTSGNTVLILVAKTGYCSSLVGGLAPDQSYYVRLYAVNSVGDDWTGRCFIRTQPKVSSLPLAHVV